MKTITVKTHAQLNALVAEEVMGWKLDDGYYQLIPDDIIQYGDQWNAEGTWIPADECAGLNLQKDGDPFRRRFVPSLAIQSAWPVVEKMAERFQVPSVGSETSGWVCQIVVHGKGLIMSTQPTAALAICLCALASVGIEVKLELKCPQDAQ